MTEVPRRSRTMGIRADAPDRAQADTDSEIAFHIEMRTDELVRLGHDPGSARAQAEQEFGDVVSERTSLTALDVGIRRRRVHQRLFDELRLDVRYALRSLFRNRTFATVALLTLGLGMGATVAIFSIVHAYLLRPLPFPAAERLVVVHDHQPSYGDAPASWPEFEEWRAQARSVELVAGSYRRIRNFTGGDYPERVRLAYASADFFPLVGARAVAGRLPAAAEHAPDAPPVLVLTESFWRSRFGGDPGVIGSSVTLGGESFTVVGVAADVQEFTTGDPTVAWTPLEPRPLSRERGMHAISVWARLRPGVDAAAAERDLQQVAQHSNEASGNDHGVRVAPMRDLLVGDTRPLLLAMLGIVTCVLLIAALNVANLLLARAASREQEFAVRGALGAGRARVALQLLVEGSVLALAGCALAIPLALWGHRLLLGALPASLPRPLDLGFDRSIWLVAAALVAGTTALFAFAPMLLQRRGRASDVLRGTRGTADAESRVLRRGAIVAELALSTMLLVAAALMIHSFLQIARLDLGYRPNGLMSFGVTLPPARYDSPERITLFREQLEQTLARIPGVDAVTSASNLPTTSGMNGDFGVQGRAFTNADRLPMAEKRWVAASYLATLGIALQEGRFFDDRDRPDAVAVAVVNETFARRVWGNESAIGKRIAPFGGEDWVEVVGVVGDVRSWGLDQPAPLEILMPLSQLQSGAFNVVLRTNGDPDAIAGAIRRTVRAADPELPLQNVRLVSELIDQMLGARRLLLVLAVGFGALALLLAAVGTAGLIAYGVARRSRELGLRMALGARPRDVLHMVMAEGVVLAVWGLLIGLVLAAGTAGLLRAHLFNVQPSDALSYVAAVAALTTATLVASYLPARAVLRIDPVSAMRIE